MSLKNISLAIVFMFFAGYNFLYTPISYFSYPLGIMFFLASIGMFMGNKKKKK